MAKKRRRAAKKTHSKKTASRKKKGGRRLTPAALKARSAAITRRVKLHSAAALLKDFHGGKLPVKSGCGRPRGS